MTHDRFVAEVDSFPCRHLQNDGSKEYHALVVHVCNPVTGQFDRTLTFRLSEAAYTTNAEMLPIFNDMARLLNADRY